MVLESFKALISEDEAANAPRTVLLGNGFSIARWPGIFSYGALFENSRHRMSDSLRALFDGNRTRDFERILAYLRDAAVVAEHHDNDAAKAKELRDEADFLRTLLIEAIADGHPHGASALDDEEKERCARFLLNFREIFTTNYDLLLYWVLMYALFKMGLPYNHFPDAFFRGDAPDGVFWTSTKDFQRVYYLHGAVHIMRQGSRHRKLTYDDEDSRVIMDTLRAAMDAGQMPLFVCEESAQSKGVQIERDAYLSYAHQRLVRVMGALYIHGSALHPVDEHLWHAVSVSGVTALRVSVFGNPDSPENEQVGHRARSIVQAAAARNRAMDLKFYGAQDPEIWLPKP